MRSILVTIIALAALVIPAHANVVISAEFREVVREASVIVRGRVTDVRSVAQPGLGIESIATVAVESQIKGQPASFVYVRVPGGEVGRSRVVVTGAPAFKVGQRAVFFLKPGTDSTLRPVALSQGVFRVQPDPGTGRLVVEPPLVSGVTAGRSGPAVRGDVRRRLMPVQEFESLVRSVLSTSASAVIRRGAR